MRKKMLSQAEVEKLELSGQWVLPIKSLDDAVTK